jgi:hypothetical protein
MREHEMATVPMMRAVTLTAEQQIALALVVEVRDSSEQTIEHRFNDGQKVFVVKVLSTPIEQERETGHYTSLGPAGEKCTCCNGSGKRP